MHLINLMVIYLSKKYGVPIFIFFFKKLTRGISYLMGDVINFGNVFVIVSFNNISHIKKQYL